MNLDDANDRYRLRELERGDPLKTLLNSLTLDSIREAAYLLSPSKKIKIRSHASSLEDILQVKQPTEKIVRTLLDVEAQTPFKHALLVRVVDFNGIESADFALGESIESGGFDFVLRHVLKTRDFLYLTLEHTVEVKDWVDGEDSSIRRLQHYETRHPIVFRVSLKTGVSILGYPGFSQGTATKRHSQISYGDLLGAALGAVKKINIETRALPVRESLKILQAGPNDRVLRIRADIEAPNVGRFDLSSLNQDKAIEESLADLLLPHIDGGVAAREKFIASAKKAISGTEINFLVLFWVREGVMTRIKFWDIGCELLFTWHGEKASYRAIDAILQLLSETEDRLQRKAADGRTLLAWISGLAAGSIVRPATVVEDFNLDSMAARHELVYAVKVGLLIPVFRLNTNSLLEGVTNDWTDDPGSLKRVWRLDSGGDFDGGAPSNLEVAFRRVEATGGRK